MLEAGPLEFGFSRNREVTMRRLSNNEEQHAQHIACGHLVRGCEDAISELQAAPSETNGRSRTRKRAQEILAHVLSSWQDTLKTLRSAEEPAQTTLPVGNLDEWTGDELFAEALARTSGDGPALRLMQGLTLRAQLTAHDHGSAAASLQS